MLDQLRSKRNQEIRRLLMILAAIIVSILGYALYPYLWLLSLISVSIYLVVGVWMFYDLVVILRQIKKLVK